MRSSAAAARSSRLGPAALAAILLLLPSSAAALESRVVLTDVTAQTGITFRHTDGGSGRRYIVETVSAGLALFDYDRDGDIDIYFLNGSPLPGTKASSPPRNALYRNEGGWKFTDVTAEAGVGDTGYGLGVAVGDYDGDGYQDLYLNNFGRNVLYRNRGDSTFSDATDAAGVSGGDRVGAGTCFLDMDGDGDLDLYVANYLKFSFDKHVSLTTRGVPVYANPRYYPPDPDTLFRNNGDGTFTDVSEESGVGRHAGWGMGIVCGDYDDDGDTDVFIGNDVSANFLFENDGKGRFREVALLSGTAFDLHGDEQGSMGVDCGDYDGDGWLDFYVTSYQSQFATLYRNLGDAGFEDVTMRTGAGAGTLPHVTWGNSIVDLDKDGHRDIFVACGHLQDNIEAYDDSSRYHARNILLMNDGRGRFRPAPEGSGDGLLVCLSSRGAGFDDLDNDGDVDIVILNSRREPTVLRNDTRNSHHWLQVELRGVKTNRDGVGARVTLVAGGRKFVDEVHSGRGYQGHHGSRLYFGLGSASRVDRLEIRWVGGGTDVHENIAADQRITVTEGRSLDHASRRP
ncbi:MAG: CRTAC1 family protein [Planctomycetes bacterium]|nr:CRTAC1 family protein [Planctomycetota bacterium]